jgi:hypothetical protein
MRGAEEQTPNRSGDLRLVGASLVALLLAFSWRLTKAILALFSRGSLK